MILVLMVSSGYMTQSTVRPAIPPAMPCLISVIIIKISWRLSGLINVEYPLIVLMKHQ